MSERLGPDDAARALDEIGRRQSQVIDLAVLPTWYWWTIGALMVVLGIGVDTHTTTSVAVCASVFAVGVAAATARVTFGPARRARLRNDLLGPAGVLAILGFVAVIIAVTLGLAFSLRAAGVSHPATIGCAAGGLVMGLAGPALTRRLRRIMLAHRDGVAR
jgi:hypothetical protein